MRSSVSTALFCAVIILHNSAILVLTDGNDQKIFSIEDDKDNVGLLKTVERLDREMGGVFLLTIKCFRPYERQLKSDLKEYDPSMLDELQVRIVVKDIDDNSPKFVNDNTMTLGIRVNAPIYTEITRLKAVDPDPTSLPVRYKLLNVTYHRPSKGKYEILDKSTFLVDEVTGIVQTNQTYGRFSDGYFQLYASAFNSPLTQDVTKVKVYVLQDTDLMRFVFDNDPSTVQSKLQEFSNEIETVFPQPLTFNLYDTEFYSKVDGSLDFGRTSSCFQVVADDDVVDLKATERLFDTSSKPKLKALLEKYDIVRVEVR